MNAPSRRRIHRSPPRRAGPAGAAVAGLVCLLALTARPGGARAQGASGEPPSPPPSPQEVPTPASVLGFEPGADHRLAAYEEVRRYFRALDRSSDRARVVRIGETVSGRPMILVLLSSAENLDRLEELRRISQRLATDGRLAPSEADSLARRGRAVLWIDGGLHSDEVAGHQFPPVFAHRLVTSESEEVRRIRDRVVVLLMPSMNPDGQDVVVDWYRQNLGTPFETSPLPRLYHRYAGHDNNRDWFMLTQPESRAVGRQLWHRWFPQIVVNHHQEAPFPARIFVPPFADPVNPRIPELVTTGINVVGTAMHRRFAEEGKPGAVSRLTFTQWWNGGMRTAPYFHNQVGVLTEVALHAYATPRRYPADSLPDRFENGMPADRASTWYPLPWRGGWWRLADAVEYMVTASMAAAEVAARRKASWLRNANRMARRAVEAGETGDPFAYVVPVEGQHDPGEAVAMLEVLRRGGVRLHRATEAFTAGGRSYPAGTYLLYAGQPFRAHLMDMLERQRYPHRSLYPGGPQATPYDLAGWTLPLQMGVTVHRVDRPFDAAAREVAEVELAPPEGGLVPPPDGTLAVHLLDPAPNASARAVNRLMEAGARVDRSLEGFGAAGRAWEAGTFLVREAGRRLLATVAREEGVRLVGATAVGAETRRLRLPRVGVYRSWFPVEDEGWTRWVLERYGFTFETLRDADVRSGDLSRFDVIVLPDQDPREILRGHVEGTMPERFTGGLGAPGAAALDRFARAGGTLVALDDASHFLVEQLGLPVRDPVVDLPAEEFFIPGSLVRLRVDPADPLGWGVQEETAASFQRSGAFAPVPPAAEGGRSAGRTLDVAARYGSRRLLLSGWETGAREHIGGRMALTRVPVGAGQAILFAFRPQFRGQPRATFQLFFNALYASTVGELPYVDELERP